MQVKVLTAAQLFGFREKLSTQDTTTNLTKHLLIEIR